MYIWYNIYIYIYIYVYVYVYVYVYIYICWCSACAEAMCAPVFRSREQLLTQNAGKPGVVILGALQKLLFLFFNFYFSSFSFFSSKENSSCLYACSCCNMLTALRAALIFVDAQGSTLRTPAAPRYTHLTPAPPSGQVPPAQLSRDYTKPLSLTN